MSTTEIAAGSCMFAKLPKPASSGRERRQELIYSFEAVLPLPIEQLQLSFVEDDGHVIGCACRKELLGQLRARSERAIPESLPGWVADGDHEHLRVRLNLLEGGMTSLIRLRRHRQTLKLATCVLLVISAITALAADRRVAQLRQQQRIVEADIDSIYDAVLPSVAASNAQPDAIRFATLMNQLSATRTGVSVDHHNDLIPELAAILDRWPDATRAKVRGLTIDTSGARIEASVPDNPGASELIDFVRGLDAWTLRSQQQTPANDGVQLRMQLDRTGKGAGDAG